MNKKKLIPLLGLFVLVLALFIGYKAVQSATSGTPLVRRRISVRALAASMSGTARRTMSHPRSMQRLIWSAVATASRVSVLHIVCTDTGESPPMPTRPSMK